VMSIRQYVTACRIELGAQNNYLLASRPLAESAPFRAVRAALRI
jgi:hypothetical protein